MMNEDMMQQGKTVDLGDNCDGLGAGTYDRRKVTMSYTIDRIVTDDDFDAVDERVRAALAERGFGVLTEIDVKATMKKKIDADMEPYRILGACNPETAYKAIDIEPRVGAMLPCNVILRQVSEGVEISAVDPVASMQSIDNDDLTAVAAKVRDMLSEAIRAACADRDRGARGGGAGCPERGAP